MPSGRRRRVVLVPRCWDKVLQDVSQGDGGRAGSAGCPAALTLLACAKVHFLCTQGSRVRPASGIPCALLISRVTDDAELGRDGAARMQVCVPPSVVVRGAPPDAGWNDKMAV